MNLLDLAQKLLEYPSITPDDAGCQEFLKEILIKLGFTVQHFNSGRVKNLWARYGNTDPLFVFAGHTDVVPPGDLSLWQTPPFEPDIRNDYLFGRGACDMKSSLAAMIVAANIFLQKKPTFQGSIAFLITSGEEGDDFDDGTPYVMQKLAETGQIPRYCIVGEPSCEKVLGDTIKIGRRGSLTGQLKILGKQGHVAYPQLAENPIHHSSAFFNELVNIKWEEEGFQGVNKNETYSFLKDVKTLDKASAEGRTPAPERQNRSHFYSHPFFPPTSFQITQYIADSGGSNVIPGELNVGFNFRYSPVVSHEQLQQKVEALLKKHNLQYSITWRLNGLPFLTEKGPLVETAQRVIKEVCHIAPVLSTSGGTSDGRFIAPYGVDVIELGLINKTIHQINESTSIEALHQLCKVYEKVLEALL